MSDRNPGLNGEPEETKEPEERPRVKVTDRRRVRAEETPAGTGAEETPAGTGAEETPAGPATTGSDLEQARREAAAYRDHLQRLAADFDNYRKRVLKEQTNQIEMASRPLVQKLLEVLDEFDLALMAAERRPDFDRFLHGVELVYAKLVDILRSEGLEQIDAQGKPFDPELHEALMQGGGEEGEPVVGDVLRQGYTLKGRVVRPAGVKVVRK